MLGPSSGTRKTAPELSIITRCLYFKRESTKRASRVRYRGTQTLRATVNLSRVSGVQRFYGCSLKPVMKCIFVQQIN